MVWDFELVIFILVAAHSAFPVKAGSHGLMKPTEPHYLQKADTFLHFTFVEQGQVFSGKEMEGSEILK